MYWIIAFSTVQIISTIDESINPIDRMISFNINGAVSVSPFFIYAPFYHQVPLILIWLKFISSMEN